MRLKPTERLCVLIAAFGMLGSACLLAPHALDETYRYALAEYSHGEYGHALPLVRLHAWLGNPDACSVLGVMYLFGRGVTPDGKAAEAWLTKGATRGVTGAQSILGVMYATGNGVPKDLASARRWLTAAAAGGDAEAARMLHALGPAAAM